MFHNPLRGGRRASFPPYEEWLAPDVLKGDFRDGIFIDMVPPTVTAQEHKVMVRHGRPMFYDTPRLKEARLMYEHALRLYRPEAPLTGALALTVEWWFPSKTHRDGEMRVTRPDTDNLQKLLKDCMTRVGFWNDDAQVCRETVTKRWTRTKPGLRIEVTQLDG